MKRILIGAMALLAVACSPAGQEEASSAVGDWTVDPAASRVTFSTVKNGTVTESHHFKTVNGNITANGEARIVIDLASVETNEPTRNQRMRDNFFRVAEFPEAVVTAQLDPTRFSDLAIGDRRVEDINVNVALAGDEVDYDTQVFVTRAGDDKVIVETTQPIVVEAADFNLTDGVETLRQLVQIQSITPAAPVGFSLVLTREG